MKRKLKYLILVGALLVMGAIRMPVEHALSGQLRDLGLHRKQLDISTRDKIDQTAKAMAIGGMRTLVASFLNLHAHTLFSEQRWDELAQTYDSIVDFAPHTRYYWETGSWHLSYNAASYYVHDSDLSSLRRREAWRSSILRGRAFLEKGIRNNPDDWRLYASLGHLLRDPNKVPAFRNREATLLSAYEAYRQASELGNTSPLLIERLAFYSLARVEGREAEALDLARRLYQDPRHRRPTLLILLYVLEFHADPQQDPEALALRIFGDAKTAYESLKRHWVKNSEGYPMDGVALGLARMEGLLGIPLPQSLLGQPPIPPADPEDWFR